MSDSQMEMLEVPVPNPSNAAKLHDIAISGLDQNGPISMPVMSSGQGDLNTS
jgi:hypothetical protein